MRALVLACLLTLGATTGIALAAPPETHEILENRPSGFWTSNRPAVGGAYRYRLLGIGIIICGVTGFFVVRALRRASDERRAGRL